MMTTTYTITAPSGAVLRVTSEELRMSFRDARSCTDRVDPKKLIAALPINSLCRCGVFLTAAFTEEDRAIWERERRHAVPVQSFRIKAESIRITDHPQGSTTDLDSLPGLLQHIKKMADPELPMRHSPNGVQRRMERIRERLDIVINTLREAQKPVSAPIQDPSLTLQLLDQLLGHVKKADLILAYGGSPTKELTAIRNMLTHEIADLQPLPKIPDGWGHTTHDASVADLLREWAACEAGSDRHEQLFKQLMEKGVDQLQLHQLLGKVQTTQEDVADLRAAQAANRRHVTKLEEFILKEFSALRQELGLTPKATQGARINCPHPDHADEARSCTLDLQTFKWACPVCKRTGYLLALQDPPPEFAPEVVGDPNQPQPPAGVIFTPCPTEVFDKAVTEVAGLDSACEPPPMEDTPYTDEGLH